MGFGEAISTCFSKYVDFSGRAPRSEYWYWTLFRILLISVLITGAVAVRPDVFLTLFGLEILVTLLPSLAVAVRRLHDINATGWLMLVAFLPGGGLLLFVLACLPGTQGGNKHGPGPWGEGLVEVF